MRDEQELDLLNVEALITTDGAQHSDVMAHALKLLPADQRAPIVAALVRWREAREGLDDQHFPTVRQLRTRIAWLSRLAARGGDHADQHRADAAALRLLLAKLEAL